MDLFILRHGVAVERGLATFRVDSTRPLTPDGRRKMRRAAKAMDALELRFDRILSSPYVRARATAELVAKEVKKAPAVELTDHLKPQGDAAALIRDIRARPAFQSVLLVGHEPSLSNLISRLVSGSGMMRLKLRKGALCKLVVDHLRWGRCAELDFLLTARQLGAMR